MAYSFSGATPTVDTVDGRRQFTYVLLETEAAAASEWTITGLPRICTLTVYIAEKTAGAATTMQPALGTAASFTTTDKNFVSQEDAAAAYVNDQSTVRIGPLTDGSLYGRSTVDADTDNSITTVMVFVEGVL